LSIAIAVDLDAPLFGKIRAAGLNMRGADGRDAEGGVPYEWPGGVDSVIVNPSCYNKFRGAIAIVPTLSARCAEVRAVRSHLPPSVKGVSAAGGRGLRGTVTCSVDFAYIQTPFGGCNK
jgi:hypothetical protein